MKDDTSSLFDAFTAPTATNTRSPEPTPCTVKPAVPLPPAPHNGTDTSRAAAMALSPDWRATVCGRVLTYIESRGAMGATREEISKALEIKEASVCGRVADLRRMGLIEEPKHMTRATSSGAQAQVVIARVGGK